MGYLAWFAVGGIVGAAQLGWSLARRPIIGGHPFQAFAFAIVAGGLVYGTILWLIFGR